MSCLPALVTAQGVKGVTTQGNTGGLVIPSADVLNEGSLALTIGNYSEPSLGSFSRRRTYSVGVGLFPGAELFGRFADYQNPLPDSTFNTGYRDISANAKLQLPTFWNTGPKVAVGINDVSGGAVLFRSAYAVASDQFGLFRWSAGYARGSPVTGNASNGYAFKGAFAGAEFLVGTTGLSVLAEYDGQQSHAGLRYGSQPIAMLGNAQLVGTVQRGFGATNRAGRGGDASAFSVSLAVPLGNNAQRATLYQPPASNVLPPVDARPASSPMQATPDDRLDALQRALVATGLERVRVGLLAGNLLVEYENHRYGQNEADAIGIVLGLAVEHAPAGVLRAYAVTLKAGLRVYETSVAVSEYRNFLRSGESGFVNGSLAVDGLPNYRSADVKWLNVTPARRSMARIEIKPEINYAVATDLAAFDYSFAANVQGIVPLWQGAELYTSYVHRLSESENFQPGFFFEPSRQRNGLKVAALQQSLWLGRHIFVNGGFGRFNYNAWGLQFESSVFVPGGDDVIRLKAGIYQAQPGETRRQSTPLSGTYRWVYSPSTWVEAGVQQYSDGTSGPSVVLTRWFGDVGASLFYRKGGLRQYAGLELSIPLTPRRGMEPLAVEVTGTSKFTKGARTRLTDSHTAVNVHLPSAALDFALDYNAEVQQLNGGRMSQKYFISQLPRMREAFYLYARQFAPN